LPPGGIFESGLNPIRHCAEDRLSKPQRQFEGGWNRLNRIRIDRRQHGFEIFLKLTIEVLLRKVSGELTDVFRKFQHRDRRGYVS